MGQQLSVARGVWVESADQLTREVSGASYGSKVELYESVGSKYGLNSSVVRRLLRARQSLTDVSKFDPQLAARLKTEPFIVTEVVARWAKRSTQEAIEAANAYLSRKITSVELVQMERTNRPARPAHELTYPEWKEVVLKEAERILHPRGYTIGASLASLEYDAVKTSHLAHYLFCPKSRKQDDYNEEDCISVFGFRNKKSTDLSEKNIKKILMNIYTDTFGLGKRALILVSKQSEAEFFLKYHMKRYGIEIEVSVI